MNTRIKNIYRLFLGLALLALPVQVSATPFSHLVVFGDSLSDSGNIALATGGAVQPVPFGGLVPTAAYLSGRFSNGPVWVEELAASLGLPATPALAGGTNFAFGGARTGPFGTLPPASPSLLDQHFSFNLATGGVASPEALYVVWGGGNDVRDAAVAKTGGDDPGASAIVDSAVFDIATLAESLATAGAVDILVPNLSDLGLNPESVGGGFGSEASAVSAEFNADLEAALSGLAADPAINLIELDIFGLMSAINASPASFGFTNVVDPCVDLSTVCSNPEDFLFYDGIHPTAAGHARIASLAHAAVVPEPSTLLLFGSGLVGLFVLRRKMLGHQ